MRWPFFRPHPVPCHPSEARVTCPRFWEGGESLFAQAEGGKSEHHEGAMPRNSGSAGDTRGRNSGDAFRRKVPQRTYRLRRKAPVRVKRCGKSAPREAQATRHGKPHRVQGQIGNRAAARRRTSRASGTDRFRVWAAQTNDSLRPQGRRQKSAYSPLKITSFRIGDTPPRGGTAYRFGCGV